MEWLIIAIVILAVWKIASVIDKAEKYIDEQNRDKSCNCSPECMCDEDNCICNPTIK